jgi:hypothetical protein
MNDFDFTEAREALTQQLSPPLSMPAIERRSRRRRQKQLSRVAVAVIAVVVLAGGTFFGIQRLNSVAQELSAIPAGSKLETSQAVDEKTTFGILRLPDGNYAWTRTTDGGRSWRTWKFPAKINEEMTAPDSAVMTGSFLVMVLDRSNVMVGRSFITHDGGESWDTRPQNLGAPIDTLPGSWQLVNNNPPYAPAGPLHISGYDPATGQIHPLAHAPSDCFFTPTQSQPPDGSLWIACGSGLATSHDRGRTWQRSFQSGKTTVYPTSFDGKTGYAYVIGATPPRKDLYKTTDGGQHWQWLRSAVNISLGLQQLADGSLVHSADGQPPKLFRSTNDGASFTQIDVNGANFGSVRTAVGAYVAQHWNGQELAPYVSDNAINYVPVPTPPGVS